MTCDSPNSRWNSILRQAVHDRGHAFGRGSLGRLFVNDAELHLDHMGQGVEAQGFVDHSSGRGRSAEDVDHVDCGRDVGKAGISRPAANEPAGVAGLTG
jgi:hypothetical protein